MRQITQQTSDDAPASRGLRIAKQYGANDGAERQARKRERDERKRAREAAAARATIKTNEEIEIGLSLLADLADSEGVRLGAYSALISMRGLGKQPPAPPVNPFAEYVERLKQAATGSHLATSAPVFTNPAQISTDSKPLETPDHE